MIESCLCRRQKQLLYTETNNSSSNHISSACIDFVQLYIRLWCVFMVGGGACVIEGLCVFVVRWRWCMWGVNSVSGVGHAHHVAIFL